MTWCDSGGAEVRVWSPLLASSDPREQRRHTHRAAQLRQLPENPWCARHLLLLLPQVPRVPVAGMDVEGIFRRSANALEVTRVRDLFNAGESWTVILEPSPSLTRSLMLRRSSGLRRVKRRSLAGRAHQELFPVTHVPSPTPFVLLDIPSARHPTAPLRPHFTPPLTTTA